MWPFLWHSYGQLNDAPVWAIMSHKEPVQLVQWSTYFKWMSLGPHASSQIRCILGATKLGAPDHSWLSLWKTQTCAWCGPRGQQHPLLQPARQPLPSNAIARQLTPALSPTSRCLSLRLPESHIVGWFLNRQQRIYVKSNNITPSTEVTFSFW